MTNDCRVWSLTFITHVKKRQYCYVEKTSQQCRWGLFQDSDFAGDLEDSKPTSGGLLCIFRMHTFVPISWMCKKQTSVSHSSTEAEIISLDAGLRMDGIPALGLWDLVIEVFLWDCRAEFVQTLLYASSLEGGAQLPVAATRMQRTENWRAHLRDAGRRIVRPCPSR